MQGTDRNNNSIQHSHASKIYFWDTLLVPDKIVSLYLDKINQLCSGDLNGLNLEKLKGTKIYSIRVNGKIRLLFAKHNRSFLFLEELKNHEYNNSQFVKSRPYVNKFLSKKNFSSEYQSIPVNKLTVPNELKNGNGIEARPINCMNGQIVEFTDAQKIGISARFPLVLMGHAGSGKTWVGVQSLWNLARTSDKPLLYVTKEPMLAETAEELFKQLPPLKTKVYFKSYKDLVMERMKVSSKEEEITIVKKQDFEDWLQEGGKSQQLKESISKFSKKDDNIYEELRLISGLTKETYLNLGERETVFAKNLRSSLFTIYEGYLSYLQNTASIDLCLNPPQLMDGSFGAVCIDEAQDFSLRQLGNLTKIADDHRVMYLIDNHQSLDDTSSKLHFIATQINREWKLSQVYLDKSYRCRPSHIAVANKLLAVEYSITGGKSDKFEKAHVDSAEILQKGQGDLSWYESLDEMPLQVKEQIKELAKSKKFAIITSKARKEEIRRHFPDAVILPPERIKGHEYEAVLVYGLMGEEELRSIEKELKDVEDLEALEREVVNRAKNGRGQRAFGPFFHKAHVALTRAKKLLMIVQKCGNSKLLSHLKTSVESLNTIAIKLEATTQQDWKIEAEKYEKEGNIELANEIRKRHGFLKEELKSEDTPKKSTSKSSRKKGKKPKKKKETDPIVLNKKLLLAVSNGSLSEVRNLLKNKTDPNCCDEKGYQPIHIAAQKGDIEVLNLLIERGINFTDTTKGEEAKTPLLLAIENAHVDVAKLLAGKSSLMHFVCAEGHLKCLKKLHQIGESLNSLSTNGLTPLMVALKNGQKEVAEFLIQCSEVDLMVKNENLETAFSIAMNEGLHGLAKMIVERSKKQIAIKEKLLFQSIENRDYLAVESLIKSNVDINARNEENDTPVLVACNKLDARLLWFLVNNKADLNIRNNQRLTPLKVIAAAGLKDVAEDLLSYGAKIETEEDNGVTALFLACKSGKLEMVKMLHEKGADINCHTSQGLTPLIAAIQMGFDCIVKYLLENDVNLDLENRFFSPFVEAITLKHLTILKLLMDATRTQSNTQLLKMAIMTNWVEGAEWLIENRAIVNDLVDESGSLLHLACMQNYLDMVRLLLVYNADVTIRNSEGSTPFDYACQNSQVEIAKLLYEHTRDVVSKSLDDSTYQQLLIDYLLCAVRNNQNTLVDMILKESRDPQLLSNEIGKDGIPVLMHACKSENLPSIQSLISFKANVNCVAFEDFSPLMILTAKNNDEGIKLLLDNGANVYFKDSVGMNVLILAARIGHLKVIRLFKTYGADLSTDFFQILSIAVSEGHLDIIKFLLEEVELDEKVKDEGVEIAKKVAVKYNRKEIEEYLTSKSLLENNSNKN